MKISFDVDFSCIQDFERFTNEFDDKIILNGLDATINNSLDDLKDRLKSAINQNIRSIDTLTEQDKLETKDAFPEKPKADISKSDEEILKFLTGVDPTKYNKAKNYSELSDSKMIVGQLAKSRGVSDVLRLRMSINDSESLETQYEKAKEFFKDAVIALPMSDGTMSYFMPVGDVDLTKHLKIVCSTQTGVNPANKPKKGLTPQERFDLDTKRGYAEWTLKQEAVELIKQGKLGYVKLDDIIREVKQGEYGNARAVAKNLPAQASKAVETLVEKTEQIEQKIDLNPSTEAYLNVIDLVKSLGVEKVVKGNKGSRKVVYWLNSTFREFTDEDLNIKLLLFSAINSWIIDNEDPWFFDFVKQVENLIDKFNSGV